MISRGPDEPSSELDRKIYELLTNGQRQQETIVRLLQFTNFDKGNIRNSVSELEEKYPWAVVVEENNKRYVYRKDVGRQPVLSKPPADHSNIEEILLGLEIKLGIKSQNEVAFSELSSTLPELLNDLLEKSTHKGKILTSKDHFKRFFEVFDKMIIETENAYSTRGPPPNYPKKNYGLFYTIIAQQHESWKSKSNNSHIEFDKEIQKRREKLKSLLNIVPPHIGNQIMRILALVDIKEARDGFEIILRSNKYNTEQLITHAESCYVISNDINTMINDLSLISMDCENNEIKEKIKTIRKSVDTNLGG